MVVQIASTCSGGGGRRMTLLLCLGAVMTISLMIVDNVAMSRNGACDMWLGFKVHSYLEAHTLPLF